METNTSNNENYKDFDKNSYNVEGYDREGDDDGNCDYRVW